MNSLLLLPEEVLPDGTAVITGTRVASIQQSHELEEGITVAGGVLNGMRGKISVVSLTPERIGLKTNFSNPPLPRFATQIIVAVPRPQTVKKVLNTASSMGVDAIHFLRAENVEKSYLTSHALLEPEIREEIFKGLEQAGDTIPPVVQVHSRFKPFVEDVVPGIFQSAPWNNGPLLCLGHTANDGTPSVNLASIQFGNRPNRPVMLAIGPESGWAPHEVESFKQRGFLPLTLGPRTLRVETALAVFLGEIEVLRGLAERA